MKTLILVLICACQGFAQIIDPASKNQEEYQRYNEILASLRKSNTFRFATSELTDASIIAIQIGPTFVPAKPDGEALNVFLRYYDIKKYNDYVRSVRYDTTNCMRCCFVDVRIIENGVTKDYTFDQWREIAFRRRPRYEKSKK